MTDKELLTHIQKLQKHMSDVATTDTRIQTVDDEYKQLYYKIAVEFDERDVENTNPHTSLWDFYDYWSIELPSYQNRRTYIRNLYKEVEDSLQKTLIKTLRAKSSVRSTSVQEYKLSIDDLHEDVTLKCKDLFTQGNHEEAIHNAYKLVEVAVRSKGGFTDADFGASLMHRAFEPKQTRFIISDDDGEVAGWQKLYAGAIGALKNPHSHRFAEIGQQEAFQLLSFASYLLSFFDNLEIREDKKELDKPIDLSEIPF